MPKFTDQPTLGPRFETAMRDVSNIHRRQIRKGEPAVPYIGHLMAVSSLVIELGCSEDVAIAALFHDSKEDIGAHIIDHISASYGVNVASLVLECSEHFELLPDGSKPPWRDRKQAHLNVIEESASEDALKIMWADKVHNMRSLANDLRKDKPSVVWGRLTGGQDGTMWYYSQFGAIAAQRFGYSSAETATYSELYGQLSFLSLDGLSGIFGKNTLEPRPLQAGLANEELPAASVS